MREITGDLWDYHKRQDESGKGYMVCVTTNGTVKNNGECVTGRGCAFEATVRFPEIARHLGELIRAYGNRVWYLPEEILSFPVKHQWWEKADLELIRDSSTQLAAIAGEDREIIYVLPRPGCGNGRLKWGDVELVIASILPDNVWVIHKVGAP